MKRSLAITLLFLAALGASGQEGDTFQLQIDDALQINIGYRILSMGEEPVFYEDSREPTQVPTFPGNPVTVWLKDACRRPVRELIRAPSLSV